MIVGAPLANFLSVEELGSGVAHELGHFAGGDTRLTGFSTQTHALFASVVENVQRDPFRVGTRHAAPSKQGWRLRSCSPGPAQCAFGVAPCLKKGSHLGHSHPPPSE